MRGLLLMFELFLMLKEIVKKREYCLLELR